MRALLAFLAVMALLISPVAAGSAQAQCALGGLPAFAGEGRYMCQTWSPAKNAPPATRCITWTCQADAQLQAASCDPAKMAYMARPEPSAPPTAG